MESEQDGAFLLNYGMHVWKSITVALANGLEAVWDWVAFPQSTTDIHAPLLDSRQHTWAFSAGILQALASLEIEYGVQLSVTAMLAAVFGA